MRKSEMRDMTKGNGYILWSTSQVKNLLKETREAPPKMEISSFKIRTEQKSGEGGKIEITLNFNKIVTK